MNTAADRLPLAYRFDAHQRDLNVLGYQIFGLLSRALRAMYPTAAYVTVSTDSVDEARYLERVLSADGTMVYDFTENDGEQLPELPAALAAEFGRHYDPSDLRAVQLLPYVPEHMNLHAEGAVRCLLLDPV